ncbi:hypothetical protein OSB04_018055 [Centaurea solstitialis]|uniref:F-box associated domain-containing protein n=1 Tax=Centaurea solstitialis TaxID=347529 RepID=A0AA38T421_9ASTR|nr:hypothetical protein OSB04_018055 [Centaurea solstitialis]
MKFIEKEYKLEMVEVKEKRREGKGIGLHKSDYTKNDKPKRFNPYLLIFLKNNPKVQKIRVMSCVVDHDYEVVVMNEYGVVESWAKHHAFPQFMWDVTPYGFTLNNEFLFEPANRRLALYDPSEAKVKYFKFPGRVNIHVKVVEYVDSLVWIASKGSTFRKD